MDTIWDLNNMEYTSDEIEYWLKEEYTMNKISSTYEPKYYFRDLIIKKRIQENETIMGNIKKAVDNLYENVLSMIEDYNSANHTKFTYIECFGKDYNETENIQKRIDYLDEFSVSKSYKIIINYIFAQTSKNDDDNKNNNSIYDKDEIEYIINQLNKLYSQQYDTKNIYDIPFLYYYSTCLVNRGISILDKRTPIKSCTGVLNPNYTEYLDFFGLPDYESNGLYENWFGSIGRYRRVQTNVIKYSGSGYSGSVPVWFMMSSFCKNTNTKTFYTKLFFMLIYWLCPYHHTLEEIANVVLFYVSRNGNIYDKKNIHNTNDLFNYLLKIALVPHNNT